MHRARQSIPTVFLLLLLSASTALAGDHSDCLSVPAKDMIVRVDASTQQATPFLTGLNTPFHGFHVQRGNFYLPDHGFRTILRVDASGTPTLLASGGDLTSPVAIRTDPGAPSGVSSSNGLELIFGS